MTSFKSDLYSRKEPLPHDKSRNSHTLSFDDSSAFGTILSLCSVGITEGELARDFTPHRPLSQHATSHKSNSSQAVQLPLLTIRR